MRCLLIKNLSGSRAMENPTEVPGGETERPSTLPQTGDPICSFQRFRPIISRMADFDLRTLSRNILLIVAILSCVAITEMLLVAAEDPREPSAGSSQQVSLLTTPSN